MTEKNYYCRDCYFFRQISNQDGSCINSEFRQFIIGNLKRKVDDQELKIGCWKEREKKEMFILKPEYLGIGVDLKEVWIKIKNYFKK